MAIVVPVTDSAQFKRLPIQVYVTAAELGPGGDNSVVECGHVRTVDMARIKKHLGELGSAAMVRVDQALKVRSVCEGA